MAGITQTSGQLLLTSGSVSAAALHMGTTNTGWYLGNGVSLSRAGVEMLEFPGSGVAAKFGSNLVGGTGLTPLGSDGTEDCGTASFRWASVWSVNGTVQTSHSDFKTEIQPLSLELEVPLGISYKWKDTEGTDKDRPYIGFLADNLPKEAFALDANGEIEKRGVKSSAVIGILCAQVRALQDKVTALETKISILKGQA